MDIFLIDWERSRGRILSKEPGKPNTVSPVSIWRTLFVGNEFNEIQVRISKRS
jgi:hypothetical protein